MGSRGSPFLLLRLARCAPKAWSLAVASRSTATLGRRTGRFARWPIGQLNTGTATWLAWTLVSAVVRTISHRRTARRVATTGWTRTPLRRIATTSRTWRARTALGILASALRTRRAWLLLIRVVGTGIGVVGGKARRVAGMAVGPRRALLSIALALATGTRALRAGTAWTARLIAEVAFTARRIRTVAAAGWTACAAWAAGTRTVVVRTRACVVAAGAIATRARRALRTCWTRLLAVRVVGTRIGMV